MVRFYALSAEALIAEATVADPPIRTGDRAELQLGQRRVMLDARVVDFEVEWREVVDVTAALTCT